MQHMYLAGNLEELKAQGVVGLRFYCLGWRLPFRHRCDHWSSDAIDHLIARFGGKTNLLTLARMAGPCRSCGGRAAHVEPCEPPVQGQPGYFDALCRRREVLEEELAYVREKLHLTE